MVPQVKVEMSAAQDKRKMLDGIRKLADATNCPCPAQTAKVMINLLLCVACNSICCNECATNLGSNNLKLYLCNVCGGPHHDQDVKE